MTDDQIIDEAFFDFCDRLKKLSKQVAGHESIKTAEGRAEALRFLLRTARFALDWELENTDPRLPHFTNWDGLAVGAGPVAPNIDNSYLYAPIDPKFSYRLTGTAEHLFDIIVTICNGWPCDGHLQGWGDLNLKDLDIRDGQFELILSARDIPGKRCLKLHPETRLLMLRLYYVDWKANCGRANIHIECLDGHEFITPPLDARLFEQQLAKAAHLLEGETIFGLNWFNNWIRDCTINKLPSPAPISGSSQHISYGATRYELADDEALVVTFVPPRSRYWGMQIYSGPAFEIPDFSRNMTSLNNALACTDSDGKVRVVISAKDPGIQNWIGTGGRSNGAVFYRWVWTKDTPTPGCTVVPWSDISRQLLPDTPRLNRETRMAQLRERRFHLQQRFWY